jgi:hypothetical protein
MDVETAELFATAATADKLDAGIGVIWWATHPPGAYALTALDYDLFDVSEINADWLKTFSERSADLVAKHQPTTRGCHLRVEHPGLKSVLKLADSAYRDMPSSGVNRSNFEILPVRESESKKWPTTLDDRAFAIRPLVDSGKVVKIETGLRRFSFRAVRTNHLIAQVKSHRPGDAQSAGELLHAFVLGVLLGTTPRSFGVLEALDRLKNSAATNNPSSGPFGPYVQGRRSW